MFENCKPVCKYVTELWSAVVTLNCRKQIQWNPDFSNLLGNENWLKKSGVRKIEGITKSRLIYEGLFYKNRERKQKFHGTLANFIAFI